MEEYMMNHQGMCAMNAWERSVCTDLYDAYECPSYLKDEAWERCKHICKQMHGRNLKIIGYSCHQFSVGFMTDTHFVYITKDHDRMYYLNNEFNKQ